MNVQRKRRKERERGGETHTATYIQSFPGRLSTSQLAFLFQFFQLFSRLLRAGDEATLLIIEHVRRHYWEEFRYLLQPQVVKELLPFNNNDADTDQVLGDAARSRYVFQLIADVAGLVLDN